MKIDFRAIYILWLREMRRFFRAPSRVIGALMVPLFFLAFLGMGFKRMRLEGIPQGVNYVEYLIPGILGMAELFSSMLFGLSILWDREFGFLKEIMVTPVSRVSILLGRIAGGSTISLFQALSILLITILFGLRLAGLYSIPLAILIMIIIAITFFGLGLTIASRLRDVHGFSLVMNLVMFPLLFLSGAFYPIANLPIWIKIFAYINPLTYGIDALRGVLIGHSSIPILLNLLIISITSFCMVILGAYSFEKIDPL